MSNIKTIKSALICSVIALVLCFTMLLGTTFAWFTDSVTSSNNIIKAGTLDVTMEWAEGTADPSTVTWADASTGAIFNNDKWEPGYAEVRHIKIANVGTLALKYQFNIVANGAVSELANVIDVYYVDPAAQITDRTDLTEDMKIGTLAEVLAGFSTTASGNLVADEAHTVSFALVMQENAGNEYQGKSIGASFSVQLYATQFTSETDSFDNMYDEAANATMVATEADLVAAIANGGEVALTEDIIVRNQINITSDTIIYGLGNTLTYTGSSSRIIDVAAESGADLTIKDMTLDINNSYCQRAINYNVTNGTLILDNVAITGATKATYGVNLPGSSDGVYVEIIDCDIIGNIALNIWGKNSVINVENSNLVSYDNSSAENYVAIALNNDAQGNVAEESVLTINGGSIIAKDQNGEPSSALRNSTKTATVTISNSTKVIGNLNFVVVAFVMYKDNSGAYLPEFYNCPSIQRAVTTASKSANSVIVLMSDITVDELDVPADVTIDLNGFTMTVNNTTGGGQINYIN